MRWLPGDSKIRWKDLIRQQSQMRAFGGSNQTCHRRRSLEDVAIRAHENESCDSHWLALCSRLNQWIMDLFLLLYPENLSVLDG